MFWRIKQLVPLTYRSRYSDAEGMKHFCVWKMWLGWCYRVDDVAIL